MRPVFVCALTIGFSIFLLAQQATISSTTVALSSNPTSHELTKLFSETANGSRDLFQVLRSIGSLGDKAVPGLEKFLFNSQTDATDTTISVMPNKLFAVLALEGIGTPAAYQVLAQAALSHQESEVRGTALKAIAVSYHFRARRDTAAPDRETVHLLLKNTEDTTYVEHCAMRIGDIARAGLKNWTGIDYGRIPSDSARVKFEKRMGKSIAQSHEDWWQKYSANLKWNKSTEHFEVQE